MNGAILPGVSFWFPFAVAVGSFIFAIIAGISIRLMGPLNKLTPIAFVLLMAVVVCGLLCFMWFMLDSFIFTARWLF